MTLSSSPWWCAPVFALGWMVTVPAHSFRAPRGRDRSPRRATCRASGPCSGPARRNGRCGPRAPASRSWPQGTAKTRPTTPTDSTVIQSLQLALGLMIDHFSPRARPANFEEHQIVHCASEDEWRWVAVAFQGERRARLRRTGPNALRPVPGQVEPVALNDPHRDRAPHRTSYVCGSFLIDRFWLSVLNAARQHQGKASLAAGDARRATVPPGPSSEVCLPYSACARRPESSEKQHATTAT